MQLDNLEAILERDGIVFLIYGGFLTQPIISGLTSALENEVESGDLSVAASTNLFTIFIELAQNMMNYSKVKSSNDHSFDPKGLILVGMNKEQSHYYILSRNIIDTPDKEKVESRLKELEGLDKDELRKLYREKRKSGRDKHTKGAGIGFVEIARRCDHMEHKFETYKDDKYYFTTKTTIDL